MQKIKKLPIGLQDFKEIREADYLYIDKTGIIHNLITSSKYNFLSRPRRFGKSLLVSTLKYLFQGERELFKGLEIYDRYEFPKHPVIHIALGGSRSEERLLSDLSLSLDFIEKELEIKSNSRDCPARFRELIVKACEKYKEKVVILVDEYDKPILDNLDQIEVAVKNREILKEFYTEIKNNDAYIRFAFLTGVSKFSKAGIFSGLNNLKDLSLLPKYGNLLGITQGELEAYFGEYLRDNEVDIEKVREWYNGYNFLGDKVYNPFDLLLFIDNGFVFDNYWFSTGTPSFLIKLIEKEGFYLPQMTNLKIGKILLDSFDIENIRPEVVLFQAGYLTIEEERELEFGGFEYSLRLPNKEVRMSLNDFILDYYIKVRNLDSRKVNIHRALISGDLEGVKKELEALFASLPHQNYAHGRIGEYEGYYASVIYAYLQSLGYEIIGEDTSSIGRADLTMLMKDKIYIFEIKVDSKEKALKQIKERQYYRKYENQGKGIYLVGININSRQRNIEGFDWEKL